MKGSRSRWPQRAQALADGRRRRAAGAVDRRTRSNLDTFEINVAPENGGGPELTIGQQLGQNLYVKVQQGIGDQSTTNVMLEYELARWLRLQTNVMQGATTQQSMFQRKRRAAAPT